METGLNVGTVCLTAKPITARDGQDRINREFPVVTVGKSDHKTKSQLSQEGYVPLNPNGFRKLKLKELTGIPQEHAGQEIWIKKDDRKDVITYQRANGDDQSFSVANHLCRDQVSRDDRVSRFQNLESGFGGRPVVGKANSFEAVAQRFNSDLYQSGSIPKGLRQQRVDPIQVVAIPGNGRNYVLAIDDRVPPKQRAQMLSHLRGATVDLPGFPDAKLVSGTVTLNGKDVPCYGVLEHIVAAGGRIDPQ